MTTAALALHAAMVVGSYLLGSVPTGVLFARARGVDIRSVGSGNIGAANVARNLGKKLGLVVLVLDALKGALPMLAVRYADAQIGVDPYLATACGVAAIAGHCFSVWLRFGGGKGVATSLGVLLVADPMVTGIGAAVFAGLYAAFHIASLGSIAAALVIPALLWTLGRPPAVVLLGVAAALIILIKHRQNIRRLIHRQEYRV